MALSADRSRGGGIAQIWWHNQARLISPGGNTHRRPRGVRRIRILVVDKCRSTSSDREYLRDCRRASVIAETRRRGTSSPAIHWSRRDLLCCFAVGHLGRPVTADLAARHLKPMPTWRRFPVFRMRARAPNCARVRLSGRQCTMATRAVASRQPDGLSARRVTLSMASFWRVLLPAAHRHGRRVWRPSPGAQPLIVPTVAHPSPRSLCRPTWASSPAVGGNRNCWRSSSARLAGHHQMSATRAALYDCTIHGLDSLRCARWHLGDRRRTVARSPPDGAFDRARRADRESSAQRGGP